MLDFGANAPRGGNDHSRFRRECISAFRASLPLGPRTAEQFWRALTTGVKRPELRIRCAEFPIESGGLAMVSRLTVEAGVEGDDSTW